MSKHYESNKRWRYRNPALRHAATKRYYQKTQNAVNGGHRYTDKEIKMIVEHKIPDSQLSKEIGRSVGAIQKLRYKLRIEEYERGNTIIHHTGDEK